jgi:RNA polymerase sigma-70 factor (ECF subfamily)
MLGKTEFRLLFDTYFDAIRSFVFYRCGDKDVASDVAQEVFMKVWEKRHQWSNDNLKPLLYKMANDMLVDAIRKTANQSDFETNMILEDQSALSPEEEMVHKELASQYAKALEEMPEGQRIVFLMSRNDELKYHEIAERLEIGIKAVEKRMSAALRFLKTEFLFIENET